MNDLLFSEATRLLLEDKFGLREIQFSDILTNWMEAKQSFLIMNKKPCKISVNCST